MGEFYSIMPVRSGDFEEFWVFSDENQGIENRIFNYGMSEIFDAMIECSIKKDINKFRFLFSDEDFEGAHGHMTLQPTGKDEWYIFRSTNSEDSIGSTTGNAFKEYFPKLPEKLYYRVEECNE
jgi:hypothetical protein